MSNFKIRKYEPKDNAQVLQLHRNALGPTGADLGDGPWDDDLKDISQAYASGIFLVGELDEKIVAMGAIRHRTDRDIYEIKRMRVDPEYQRQGFGQAILTKLEEYAKSQGIAELDLDTGALQIAAQKFYEKNGYMRIGSAEFEGLPTIFYAKKLI